MTGNKRKGYTLLETILSLLLGLILLSLFVPITALFSKGVSSSKGHSQTINKIYSTVYYINDSTSRNIAEYSSVYLADSFDLLQKIPISDSSRGNLLLLSPHKDASTYEMIGILFLGEKLWLLTKGTKELLLDNVSEAYFQRRDDIIRYHLIINIENDRKYPLNSYATFNNSFRSSYER